MALAGDALFTMGCGRVFTGNFAQMQAHATGLSARSLCREEELFHRHRWRSCDGFLTRPLCLKHSKLQRFEIWPNSFGK